MRTRFLAVVLTLVATPLAAAPVAAATPAGLPSRASILTAAKLAADYYRPTFAHTTLSPTNGWSWSTYAAGVHALYQQTGDARYLADGMAWGNANSWQITTVQTNPDTILAGQTYYDLNRIDPSASLAAMDSRMATDLTALPLSRYDWIDALFMGLPNWTRWATRTGNLAYLDKLDALYAWTKDSGATSSRCAGTPSQPGLYDATRHLWYRDCTFVGSVDANGQPVFWSRGNGWVIAAMANVLATLPAGSDRAAKYADMLRTMAAALLPLQGSDGFWRTSLLDAPLYPQAETSGTALITYALASGIRTGVLDASTYLPVVTRAWSGLSSVALQPSGFVTDCQPTAAAPGALYTAPAPRTPPTSTSAGTVNADSPPFCTGAFLLAASAVAQLVPSLSTGRPVAYSAQQVGNEATRVDDGDMTTRWSASGFPQSVTVDLGSVQSIGDAMVVPYQDRAYRYRIDVSTDDAQWTTAVDRTTNTVAGSQLLDFAATSARWVRLTVTGVYADPTTWVSIQEFAVYPPSAGSAVTTYASDAFARTVTGGFGVADVGGSWTLAGTAARFAVSGGVGRLSLTAPGAGLAAFLPGGSSRDVDVLADAGTDKAATGGGTYVAVAARHTANGDYRIKVKRAATGPVTLYLSKFVAGVETTIASAAVPGLTPLVSDVVRLRLRVVGAGPTTLSAKVWKVGGAEPAAWQLTATDATAALQVSGALGVWSYLSGTSTNAPIVTTIDNLVATAP